MKQGLLILCLIAFALAGCEKASPPANIQQGVSPPPALWSAEFKNQTLNECVERAKADGNSQGELKCKCVVEKAAATIPEQRFKAIGSDPEVKALVKQIGAAC